MRSAAVRFRTLSRDMAPGLAINNFINRGMRHAECQSQATAGEPLLPKLYDLSNVSICKLAERMLCPKAIAALAHRILGVVFHCAKEKVIGFDASRVIAFVKNIHAVWDGPTAQLKRVAMGQNQPASRNSKLTIPIIIERMLPFEASGFGFFCHSPKVGYRVRNFSDAPPRAKLPFGLVNGIIKLNPAGRACDFHQSAITNYGKLVNQFA